MSKSFSARLHLVRPLRFSLPLFTTHNDLFFWALFTCSYRRRNLEKPGNLFIHPPLWILTDLFGWTCMWRHMLVYVTSNVMFVLRCHMYHVCRRLQIHRRRFSHFNSSPEFSWSCQMEAALPPSGWMKIFLKFPTVGLGGHYIMTHGLYFSQQLWSKVGAMVIISSGKVPILTLPPWDFQDLGLLGVIMNHSS